MGQPQAPGLEIAGAASAHALLDESSQAAFKGGTRFPRSLTEGLQPMRKLSSALAENCRMTELEEISEMI